MEKGRLEIEIEHNLCSIFYFKKLIFFCVEKE